MPWVLGSGVSASLTRHTHAIDEAAIMFEESATTAPVSYSDICLLKRSTKKRDQPSWSR
jgi:hypothetical protein